MTPSGGTATLVPTAVPAPSANGPATKRMSRVTLAPSKDNTLYQHPSGCLSNGSGSYLFVGANNKGERRRTVIAFDIAGVVPAGATIASAVLSLNMSRTEAGATGVQLHRVLADWGEGDSDAPNEEGTGASPAPGDATWVHRFFDRDRWVTLGGHASDITSGETVVDSLGRYSWGSTARMVADVQVWLEDTPSNFGWLIQGNESSKQTAKRFDSKENPVEQNRPLLVIEYTPPG